MAKARTASLIWKFGIPMTVVVLVIGVITSLMIASQSQSLLTTRSENTLENVLAMAHRQMSNGVPVDRLEVPGDVRFTVISADGKAMLDSDHPIEEMDTNPLYLEPNSHLDY